MNEDMVDIEVHYTLHLKKSDFDKILKEAQEGGHGFDDAGPKKTVRRYLECDGINGVELTLEDPQAIQVSNHIK